LLRAALPCALLWIAAASPIAAADTPTGDPSANRTLSSATQQACSAAPLGASCVSSALADINAARASEGVQPMALPSDFTTLTVPEQLLVLSNLERVDRGLIAISGLSQGLDANAATAAAADDDPTANPWYGNAESANWEGGFASPLESDFAWMYDDGPGSGNVDCTSPGAPGCWGHRHDILLAFQAPVVMGAAEDASSAEGPSMTELFVGGDTETAAGDPDAPLAPTWSQIAGSLPIGLSATSLDLKNGARSAQLELSASGESMNVGASITAGAGDWNVSPTSCALAPGTSCELTISVTAAGLGSTGTLTLTGPAGPQAVALASEVPAALTMRVSKTAIVYGSALTVTGELAASGGSGRAGELVTLYQRPSGSTTANLVSSATTAAGGLVRFRVSPRVDTQYSLEFAGSPTLGGTAVAAGPIEVAPRITTALRSSAIARGAGTRLSGIVTPAERGRHVALELEHGHHWKQIGGATLSRAGHFSFRIRPGSSGALRYRVVIAAGDQLAAGASAPITLRVS
jgi:hypothetical protein